MLFHWSIRTKFVRQSSWKSIIASDFVQLIKLLLHHEITRRFFRRKFSIVFNFYHISDGKSLLGRRKRIIKRNSDEGSWRLSSIEIFISLFAWLGSILSLCYEQKRALFERKRNENVRTGEIRSILFPPTLEFTQEVVRINKCAGHSSATVWTIRKEIVEMICRFSTMLATRKSLGQLE